MQANTLYFVFQDDYLLLWKENVQFQLPTSQFLTDLKPFFIRELHVGTLHNTSYVCAEISKVLPLPASVETFQLRKAFQLLDMQCYKPLVRAFAILNWDKNHHFCGRCSTPTQSKTEIFERTCPNCGLAVYPRISPSIIVRINRHQELLMARSPHFAPGVYGLIAGFVETGESLEDAVHREVQEETGIQIHKLRYFGSQPWPFPDSLMVAFTAEYLAGEIVIDTKEIEAADWYPYDQLPGRPSLSFTIGSQLIDDFIHKQKQGTLQDKLYELA